LIRIKSSRNRASYEARSLGTADRVEDAQAQLEYPEARAALADGDHYREMADKLRELARLTRSPGIRRELVDLAKRYDRRGDHFDRR
jgi:hypothetical protein